MTLKQFLTALQTANVTVTLVDLDTNTEIATLKAAGFESLDDTIEAREVKQWTLSSVSSVKVILGEVVEP